jgi:eukaryotic-like serine/threonine-protein kinase
MTAPEGNDDGEWVGRYRRVMGLGRGGMATVHLAASLGPDEFAKLVVIKELLPELNEDPDFVRMFRTEARLAARLQHPNVVQTYDAWQLGRKHLLTMEFLDGQPLHRTLTRLGRRGIGLGTHLFVLRGVLAALHYAHELCDYDGTPLGIVHRDVSPQNVFLTYDGQIKLVDFGIAKIMGAATTAVGTFKGKAIYAAPEQILGDSVDRRADLFAVGVMLWEALTGHPIWGHGSEQAHLLHRRLTGADPSVLEAAPQVDPELAAICARAMAHRPDERFATAQEFREALEAHPLGALSATAAEELGACLSATFAADREKVHARIDVVLRHAPPLPEPTPNEPEPPSHAWLASGTGASVETSRHRPAIGARSLVALGALLVAGTGVALGQRALSPAPAAQAAAEANLAPSSATVDVVTVTIKASPEQASVFVDEAPLRGNPVRFSAPADGRQHRLRAEAEGFVTEERLVVLERNAQLSFALVPAPAGAPYDRNAPKQTARPTTRPKAPPPPAAAARRKGPGRDIDDDPYGP